VVRLHCSLILTLDRRSWLCPGSFTPRKGPSVHSGSGWDPELLWKLCKWGKSSGAAGNVNTMLALSLVITHTHTHTHTHTQRSLVTPGVMDRDKAIHGVRCNQARVIVGWPTPVATRYKGWVGLRPFACRDCGLESRWGHGCLSLVSVCAVR
jgi:hypothetical protein